MNFDNLIAKYSRSFTILAPTTGEYIDGFYVEQPRAETPARGAIVGIPTRKLYEAGGYYTSQDFYLYMSGPNIGDNMQVRYNGSIYNVEECKDDYAFAGFCRYLLKWASLWEG